MGFAHEGVFIEAQQAVEVENLRDGGLTHANAADCIRLDHLDPDVRTFQEPRETGGRHPPGRAAADDRDVAYAQIAHAGPVPEGPAPDGQYRRMNSSCVGMALAAASIANRMDSRLSCTMACGSEATIGSHCLGTTFWPRSTATQLDFANNSSS
jgi:hypothetical protein